MQQTQLTSIFADANKFLATYEYMEAEPFDDDDYVKKIKKLTHHQKNSNNIAGIDDYFNDVGSSQIVNDLKHHISRASSNYIDYSEYSPEENYEIGSGFIGHVMHSKEPHNHYFRANLENLAAHIAPEYKENIAPHHYGTYGGTLTDLKHNPGILNTIDHEHKAHSNMYHELHHRNHQNPHAVLSHIKFCKHGDEIIHHYNKSSFKKEHETLNCITSPCYSHNKNSLLSWNMSNHHLVMQEARENGDYKKRDHMHKLFINSY